MPNRSILLIDPDKEYRAYWSQRLAISKPEYVLLEADTGAAGLAMCRWQRVDCVLLELGLPDMSGFRVLASLVPRIRHPEIAVIILTRVALSTLRDLALKSGAQAYLIKRQTSGDILNLVIDEAFAKVCHRECSFGDFH